MTHSPEPWIVMNTNSCDENHTKAIHCSSGGFFGAIGQACGCGASYLETDADRIVACVNACRGIPNEILDSVVYSGIRAFYFASPPNDPRHKIFKQALEMRQDD